MVLSNKINLIKLENKLNKVLESFDEITPFSLKNCTQINFYLYNHLIV